MKKTVFLVVATVLISSIQVQAQRGFYGRPVRLGFKADPVFLNNLRPIENGVEKNGSKFGINYGLMADVMLADGRGAFATGLEVAHVGASLKYSKNGLYGAGDYDMHLQYLQIPLSIKLKTNSFEGIRWWGQFGTYLGALLRSRVDYDPASSSSLSPAVSNVNILSKTNKANLGLIMGAGGEMRIAERTDLFFGLGFENGFTDITTNKNWSDGKVSLNRWAIRLGLFF